MEFVIFVWMTAAFLFLSFGLLTLIGQYIFFIKKVKNNLLYLLGFLSLSVGMWFYIPYTKEVWVSINNLLYPYIQENAGSYTYLLTEIWYTIVFFRNIWPAVLTALIVAVFENIQHPISFRYRMMKQFSHNKLLLMIGTLIAYFIVSYVDNNHPLAAFFLCLAFYTAVFYWRFGVTIILYILKKSFISYEIGILLMTIMVIVSGEFFLLPLIMCMGIGISDIWMDYYHRDAASSVFSLQFY
ncbi:MAG: hypothetical protein ACRC0X_08790 [Brevinema sp.]